MSYQSLDRQKIFNRVITHLYEQGGPALAELVPYSCMYRADDGKSCAIGCLIPDEYYDDNIESLPVRNTKVLNILENIWGVKLTSGDIEFLRNLQLVHDGDFFFYVDSNRGLFDEKKYKQFIVKYYNYECCKENWIDYIKLCSEIMAEKEGLKCPSQA